MRELTQGRTCTACCTRISSILPCLIDSLWPRLPTYTVSAAGGAYCATAACRHTMVAAHTGKVLKAHSQFLQGTPDATASMLPRLWICGSKGSLVLRVGDCACLRAQVVVDNNISTLDKLHCSHLGQRIRRGSEQQQNKNLMV